MYGSDEHDLFGQRCRLAIGVLRADDRYLSRPAIEFRRTWSTILGSRPALVFVIVGSVTVTSVEPSRSREMANSEDSVGGVVVGVGTSCRGGELVRSVLAVRAYRALERFSMQAAQRSLPSA